ncbi:MAG: FAD-binding oxidoreductase [Actinobacteria bacterium]|nr:MAG: FAD-binding oxidoreductase [Actinomycetota bacterium]
MTRRHPLWRDLLDDDEVAGLEPGLPDRLPRTPDVLVVGGGMVGVATAVACRRAGLGTVALVERSTLGAGATAGAGGLLVPEAHHDQDSGGIVDLGRLSLALWRELDDLVPDGVGLVDMDWLGLEPGPGLSARLPSGAEMLGAEDVARLVPELARPVDAVLVRQQARVNPLAALARLAGGLDHVATGVDVTEVVARRGRVVRVSTTAGAVSPGTVVFATGGPPDVEGLVVSVPASLVKGHIVATEPAPLRLAVAMPPLVTQVDGGRLLAGGTLDHRDDSRMVLLSPHPSGRAPGRRPRAPAGQRVDDVGPFPHRHPHGARHGPRPGPVDRVGRPARGGGWPRAGATRRAPRHRGGELLTVWSRSTPISRPSFR